MPAIIETEVFTYDELSDRAKARARDWYREGNDDLFAGDVDKDDFERVCAILGVTLRTRPVKLMGGGTRYEPVIWWSGFCSQGDGACFEGSYEFKRGSVKAMRAYAPDDTELHRIAAELAEVQKRNFYQLQATMEHRGHYYHSGCMRVTVERDSPSYQNMTSDAEETVTDCLRSLADWFYRSLELEYEYQNSEETVAEFIRSNEYTFDQAGRRFG